MLPFPTTECLAPGPRVVCPRRRRVDAGFLGSNHVRFAPSTGVSPVNRRQLHGPARPRALTAMVAGAQKPQPRRIARAAHGLRAGALPSECLRLATARTEPN